MKLAANFGGDDRLPSGCDCAAHHGPQAELLILFIVIHAVRGINFCHPFREDALAASLSRGCAAQPIESIRNLTGHY
jgi:hypothetical protein